MRPTQRDADAYSHAEACTITEASPDSGTTAVVDKTNGGSPMSSACYHDTLRWLIFS